MPRVLVLLLLFLPAAASAECGYVRDGNSMTIVVGKNPKCLSSESFRSALKDGIRSGLAAAEHVSAAEAKRAYDDRNARGAKLWTIAEQRYQATAGGTYFGQRR